MVLQWMHQTTLSLPAEKAGVCHDIDKNARASPYWPEKEELILHCEVACEAARLSHTTRAHLSACSDYAFEQTKGSNFVELIITSCMHHFTAIFYSHALYH